MVAKASDVTKDQWARYTRARDSGHTDYVQQAVLQDAYYRNEQWDPADVEELHSQGRPALTLNLYTPTINTILGEQIARKAQVRFKPRRGGDQEIADVLTKVYGQISESNALDDIEGVVFADSLILDGRGFFDVRIDFSDHLLGEVRVTALDPLNVLIDPEAKTDDPAEWQEVFTDRWLSLDEIRLAYGNSKANAVRRMGDKAPSFMSADDLYRRQSTFSKQDSMPVLAETGLNETSTEASRIRSYHVVERQYRRPYKGQVFIDPRFGDIRPAPNSWDNEKIVEYANANGLMVTERTISRVRWTVTCGSVVLHDAWSPYDEFTIIPCFAYFRRGSPFGLGRLLVSPQDQLNKVHSQQLHVINSSANAGWLVREDSLTNMEPDDLEDEGAKTGLVLVWRGQEGDKPEKIQPNQIPQGLDHMGSIAAAMLKEISGVSDALRGTSSPEVSGVAIEAQQARGSVMLQVPLDNLRKARYRLALRVLDLVQTFYSEERILMVTDEEDPLKPKMPLAINQPTAAGRLINDITLGEYDVVVSTAPARDSFDEMQFAECLSMRAAGIQVPDDVIVEYSHLARKEEVAKRMRQELGIEPTPEQQEAARAQAEFQMSMMQLSLDEKQAQVKKLAADIQLVLAKTGVELGAPEMEILREINKSNIAEQGDNLRRELAQLSSDTQLEISENAAASKIAGQAMSGTVQERVAKISAARQQREGQSNGGSGNRSARR